MAQPKSARLTDGQVAEYVPAEPILAGSAALEQLLASGYPNIRSVENAKQIIKERDGNPALYPFEIYQQAKAFLEAFNTQARVVSTRQGWHRKPGR